jgi:metallo-beta-lactamase family protein
VRFGEAFDVAPGVQAQLAPAGHILGAASVSLTHAGTTVVFTGDVGRPHDPIMPPPEAIARADYLVVESTYGDRHHDAGDPGEQLAEAVNEATARGGVLVIPAFAIDRTQEVLYLLRELIADGAIRQVPIFLDSPMALEATAAYRDCIREHDVEARALREGGVDPFAPPGLTMVKSVEESKRLNAITGPAIVISASGMATGGRVLHHLRRRLPDARNTVLFVGFQAEGTRGRRILDGEREIKIFGEMVPVRAQVRSISSLSAHADVDELTIWAAQAQEAPKLVFVTHGEEAASRALANRFATRFGWDCYLPRLEESVPL